MNSDHDILLALGEDLPVGVWVARAPGGELVYANRMFAEITGAEITEMGARRDLQAGGPDEPYGFYARDGARYPGSQLPFARVLAERCAIVADDLTIRRRDGRSVDVRVVARPVGDPITHVVVTVFDMSREVAAPPAPAAPRPAEPPRAPAIDPPKAKGLILIVDDDAMVRKVVAGTLDSLGYRTLEAVSGAKAIEIYRARHHEIRAVVLDMVMPDMPGKATYLALREVRRDVPVLLMTGHMLNAQVQELLDLGVRGFLSKPYTIAELAEAVAELTR